MNLNRLKQKYKKQNKYIVELTDEVENIVDEFNIATENIAKFIEDYTNDITIIKDDVSTIKENTKPEEVAPNG